MDTNYSRTTLLRFLDTIGTKGLANANTAQSLRVSCGKILVDLSDAEEADIRKVDVALAVRKFNNKNPGVLSPASLAEYQRRVTMAIREFDLYQGNPTGYRGIGQRPVKSENSEKPGRKKEKPTSPTPRADGDRTASGATASSSGLSHTFPLRADFLAQLVLPRDMKTAEAQRLCAFIRALAADFAPDA